jgi:CHAD domain-containing protein
VLGTTGDQFVDEIKVMQDILGRLQDIRVAEERIADLIDSGADEAALTPYLERIAAERQQLEANLMPAWDRFNTRTVQSKLANALLVLR